MKKYVLILGLSFLAFACQTQTAENTEETTQEMNEPAVADAFFGDKIDESEIAEAALISEKIQSGDTTSVLKFTGKIQETCEMKGCWMNVTTAAGDTLTVRFKDYGFFVPKQGAEGFETVLRGRLKKEEISVEKRKHYAKDAGKSEAEIAAITEPEAKYTFEADGVIIKNMPAENTENSEKK